MACQSVFEGQAAVFDHSFPKWIPAAQIDLFVDSIDEGFFARKIFVQERLSHAKSLGQFACVASKTNFSKITHSLLGNVFFPLRASQAFGAGFDGCTNGALGDHE